MPLKSWIVRCAACIAVALASPVTFAQSCAGFTDVSSASSFCPNVEWLKNRAITLGCTSVTLYCPGDAVSRLAMAAFLNRLGTALTPVEMAPVTAVPAVRALAGDPVICSTPDFAVTGFPRRAYTYGHAHLSVPTTNLDVRARVVYSTNGGVNWTPIDWGDQYATLYTGATPGNHISLAPFGWVDLNVGTNVRFGVQLSRFDSATAASVTAGCSNSVSIGNRNGTSSPLDPAAAASRSRGG